MTKRREENQRMCALFWFFSNRKRWCVGWRWNIVYIYIYSFFEISSSRVGLGEQVVRPCVCVWCVVVEKKRERKTENWVDEASAKAGARWLPAEFFKRPPFFSFFLSFLFLFLFYPSSFFSSYRVLLLSSTSLLLTPRYAGKHSPLFSSSFSSSPPLSFFFAIFTFTSKWQQGGRDPKKVSCLLRGQSIHFSFSDSCSLFSSSSSFSRERLNTWFESTNAL